MAVELEWWGYLHTDGSIQVKRYFSLRDLLEADESPFVQARTGLFTATDREAAYRKVKELLLPAAQESIPD